MGVDSIPSLVQAIRRSGLLSPAQLNELRGRLAISCSDLSSLVELLVKKNWLTQYQADLIVEDQEEELCFGPYHVLSLLGEGGLSRVCRAWHTTTHETSALKILHPELRSNAEVLAQFRLEMQALAQLDHPNFIKAFDIDLKGNRYWFTMEIVEGIDLLKLLEKAGPLPIAQACDYIRQTALGLQYAYEHGLVHRDIKPANLLVSRGDHRVRILDIGLARQEWNFLDDAGSTPAAAAATSLMGTADYIAPEQAANPAGANVRADIYSLGCTLFHLLAGRVPFPGRSLAKKLLDHQKLGPPSVRELRPDVSPELAALVQKMMAKQAGDRIQTPAGVAVALKSFSTRDASWISLDPYVLTNVSHRPGSLSSMRLDLKGAAAILAERGIANVKAKEAPRPALTGPPKGVERRSSARRAGNPVSIFLADQQKARDPVPGWVINRCPEGLGLLIEDAVEVGTVCQIRPAAEQYSNRWMQVKIIFCHQERTSWRVGCQFIQKPSWGDMRIYG